MRGGARKAFCPFAVAGTSNAIDAPRPRCIDGCGWCDKLLPMIHDGRSRKLPFDAVEAVEHLKANDAKLGALIERAGPFTLRLDALPSPFESLLESILYQQLHGKAAATIHRRVREYFGGDPSPQLLLDTPDEPLRAAASPATRSRR